MGTRLEGDHDRQLSNGFLSVVQSNAYVGKLSMPTPDAHWLPRPALLDRLNQGLAQKLILISAPLGFGKTMLAVRWLEQTDLPSAWITLDKGDDGLIDFIRLLAHGIRRVLPDACQSTLTLVENASSLAEQLVFEAALIDLSAIDRELLIVLDNCEALSNAGIHRLIRALLAVMPANLHLVALTRIDPPWHLAKLRLKNQVCDIRGSDLQFSKQESSAYINRSLHPAISDETLAWLDKYTEGWPAALHMAQLAMSSHSPDALMMSFRGTNRQITEYFAEEVLNSLPEETQVFLLAASVPDQFCASLIEGMLPERALTASVHATITELENAGLFINPLDAERVWYRLHPIFRDFLSYHLRKEQGIAVQRRYHLLASAWFDRHNMVEQAVQHALAAGDVDRAGSIVLAQIKPVQASSTAQIINQNMRLVAQFSKADQRDRIDLLCMQTVIAAGQGNDLENMRLMKVIEARLSTDPSGLHTPLRSIALGMVRAYQGEQRFWLGDGAGAISAFDEALSLLPEDFVNNRNTAMLFRAGAICQTLGKPAALEAVQEYTFEALGRSDESIFSAYIAQLLVQHMCADLISVERAAQEMAALIETRNARSFWKVFPLYFLGICRFEANDLAGAAICFSQLAAMSTSGNVRIVHDSMLALAMIHQIEGNADQCCGHDAGSAAVCGHDAEQAVY